MSLKQVLVVIALTAMVLMAGCTGSAMPPFSKTNPQSYSGINEAEFSYPTEQGEITGRVIGGKEQEAIGITVRHPSGIEVEYSASGARAFKGQDIRRAVEEAVSEDAREVMPGIVDSVTQSIIDGLKITQ